MKKIINPWKGLMAICASGVQFENPQACTWSFTKMVKI